ncbi:MAG: hypothetical protein ACR2PZ_05390 [Pseudomonadales bacterium]
MSRHLPPASRILALAIISLLLLACATPHTPEVWVGANFERLNRAFGDPAGILINARNNRIYAFRFDAVPQTVASDDTPTPIAYGDATLALAATDCVILFELSGPAVIAWDWQGDGCGQRALPLPYQYP